MPITIKENPKLIDTHFNIFLKENLNNYLQIPDIKYGKVKTLVESLILYMWEQILDCLRFAYRI